MNDFGWALKQAKEGKKVKRKAWYIPAELYVDRGQTLVAIATENDLLPIAPIDILAEDWVEY
jgi:hypothetical protein